MCLACDCHVVCTVASHCRIATPSPRNLCPPCFVKTGYDPKAVHHHHRQWQHHRHRAHILYRTTTAVGNTHHPDGRHPTHTRHPCWLAHCGPPNRWIADAESRKQQRRRRRQHRDERAFNGSRCEGSTAHTVLDATHDSCGPSAAARAFRVGRKCADGSRPRSLRLV